MFDRIRQGMAWFVSGLVDVLAASSEPYYRRARLLLAPADGGYAVTALDGSSKGHLRVDTSEERARISPAGAALVVKGKDLDILSPGAELIVRTLDPLPADSRPYLDGIVRHQLERLVPWRGHDVLFSYRVAQVAAKDERLLVTIAATARSLHAGLIDALQAADASTLRLLYRGVPEIDEVAIDIGDDTVALQRLRRLRLAVVSILLMLTVSAAAAFGLLGYRWQRASAAIERHDSAIALQRRELMGRRSHRTANHDGVALLALKRKTPVAVLTINTLAKLLPDQTWITDLRVVNGHVRMTGISRDVSKLVPLMESSPDFANATFFAPTIRLPGKTGDRFYLQARLVTGRHR